MQDFLKVFVGLTKKKMDPAPMPLRKRQRFFLFSRKKLLGTLDKAGFLCYNHSYRVRKAACFAMP